jgi:hypothetical protein
MNSGGATQFKREVRGQPPITYFRDPKNDKSKDFYELTDFGVYDKDKEFHGLELNPNAKNRMNKKTKMWNQVDALGALWIRYMVITFLITIILSIIGFVIGLFCSKSGFTRIAKDKFSKYV